MSHGSYKHHHNIGYTKLKVSELKEICASFGIDQNGTKKELLRKINDILNNETTNIVEHFDDVFENTGYDEHEQTQEYNHIKEIQNIEFEESLRLDRLKDINDCICKCVYERLSISDMVLACTSRNINTENVTEKYEFISLLKEYEKNKQNEMKNFKDEEKKEETTGDLHLSREELRYARLKFYS